MAAFARALFLFAFLYLHAILFFLEFHYKYIIRNSHSDRKNRFLSCIYLGSKESEFVRKDDSKKKKNIFGICLMVIVVAGENC